MKTGEEKPDSDFRNARTREKKNLGGKQNLNASWLGGSEKNRRKEG